MNIKKTLAMSVCVMMSGMVLGISAFADKTEKDITDSEYTDLSMDKRKNCVYFARYKTPSLPGGLNTYQDKVNKAKNKEATETPSQGWVAIEDLGTDSGHVAWVKSATKNGQIITVTTHDGGWGAKRDRVYERTGTVDELNITGYFKP